MSETVTTIDIQDKLPKVASGKVRDLFAVDDDTLLFVASDRISAYDVIMENVSGRCGDEEQHQQKKCSASLSSLY